LVIIDIIAVNNCQAGSYDVFLTDTVKLIRAGSLIFAVSPGLAIILGNLTWTDKVHGTSGSFLEGFYADF